MRWWWQIHAFNAFSLHSHTYALVLALLNDERLVAYRAVASVDLIAWRYTPQSRYELPHIADVDRAQELCGQLAVELRMKTPRQSPW